MPSSLKPISTRSALLTLLIGGEVATMTTRELVATVTSVGFAEPTVRVALSRMHAAGDVVRNADGSYRLSDRLQERQRRQQEAAHPRTVPWDGQWDLVVLTATGRSAAARAETRSELAGLRLAELREGVWTRPANLELDHPTHLDELAQRFTSAPVGDPAALAAQLWDLAEWARAARRLLKATEAKDEARRFTACALAGRHLLSDPVLPDELLPARWPGNDLRETHLASRRWINEMRRSVGGAQPRLLGS